jgi:hypothetical protein
MQGFGGGKTSGRRWLGRARSRWEDNIKTYLQEIEWRRVERVDLVHDSERWMALEGMGISLVVS